MKRVKGAAMFVVNLPVYRHKSEHCGIFAEEGSVLARASRACRSLQSRVFP